MPDRPSCNDMPVAEKLHGSGEMDGLIEMAGAVTESPDGPRDG